MIRKHTHSDLIERCRQGDAKAQTRVYELYCRAMYNTAYRILDDAFLAEDVMQEAFINAFQNLQHFSESVSFGAWLKRIVVNTSINEAKKRQKGWDIAEELSFEQQTIGEEAEPQVGQLTVNLVHNSINKLARGYRIILSLYLLEGYDHEEIGEILTISPSTSRSQYTRAKQKLKAILLKDNQHAGRI